MSELFLWIFVNFWEFLGPLWIFQVERRAITESARKSLNVSNSNSFRRNLTKLCQCVLLHQFCTKTKNQPFIFNSDLVVNFRVRQVWGGSSAATTSARTNSSPSRSTPSARSCPCSADRGRSSSPDRAPVAPTTASTWATRPTCCRPALPSTGLKWPKRTWWPDRSSHFAVS